MLLLTPDHLMSTRPAFQKMSKFIFFNSVGKPPAFSLSILTAKSK